MGCAPSKSSNQVVVNSHSRPQPRQEEKQLLLQSSPNKSAANTDTTDFNQNSNTNNVGLGAVQEIKQLEVADRPAESSVQKPSPVKKPSEKSADIQKISYEKASQLLPQDPDEMWAIVKGTSDKVGIHIEPLKNRKGWRTIRIFVSSTFKDFHQEREVLVKEVCTKSLF